MKRNSAAWPSYATLRIFIAALDVCLLTTRNAHAGPGVKEMDAGGGISTTNGRVGVFYRREDLSACLVGEPVDGILGYTQQTAVQLMRDMILYAERAGK